MFQFTYKNISKPFDYLYTLIMNGLIDTTAPYVNIFICYRQQTVKVPFCFTLPLSLASCRYAGFMSWIVSLY